MIVVSSSAQTFIPHHRGKWVYQLLSPIPVASAPVHGRLAASDSHLVPAHAHTHAHHFNNHFQVKVLIKCSTEFTPLVLKQCVFLGLTLSFHVL